MKHLKIYEEFVSRPTKFLDRTVDPLNKDLELIDSFTFVHEGGAETIWKILRRKDGKYILLYCDRTTTASFNQQIQDYDAQKKHMEDYIKKKQSSKVYNALHQLLKRMGSYDFQKKYLTKHPERIKELEPFGYNDKIKEEFPALIRGSKWGFFDLEDKK